MKTHIPTVLAVLLLASVPGWSEETTSKETAGQYVDDTVITAKIKEAFLSDPTLKLGEIKVETYKGNVQLSGFVSSQRDIDHAAVIAAGVSGVKSIKNDLTLKS